MKKQTISTKLQCNTDIAGMFANAIKLHDMCKKLDGYYISTEDVESSEIVAKLKYDYSKNRIERQLKIDGYISLYTGKKLINLSFGHKSGSYNFYVPVLDGFTNEYLSIFGIKMDSVVYDAEIEIDTALLKKAAKFCNTVILREYPSYIRIEIKGTQYNIVATDAHHLFNYKQFSGDTDKVVYIHYKTKFDKVSKLQFIGNDIFYNGTKLDQPKYNYPEYKGVFAQYSNNPTIVPKKELIAAINQVKPCISKHTCKIDFHVNGQIKCTGTDIDMGLHGEAVTGYISSSIDYDFSANYKKVNNCLTAIDSDNISLYYESSNKPLCIIDNQITALFMPMP